MNLGSLNPQQRQAVKTLRGPVLILAGAGPGKTRVITSRIARMVQEGIAPDNILAVTFTNKAAREMRERVQKLLPRKRSSNAKTKQPRPTLCTFHSLGVRILRRHIERLGYKKNFVIYDSSEQLSVVKKILSHINAGKSKVDPYAVLSLISRAKNKGAQWNPDDDDTAVMAERVLARYESALRACNAVDFDDLLTLTLRLLEEHDDIRDACQQQYQYVMVDEYQDTNAAQFRLTMALCRKHRNLCVVGDDDQSIYGWRGAEIANLLDLEQHFPDIKIITLEQNYRSTDTILQAANAVIRNNARRRGKKLWSQNGAGEKIELHTFESDEEEARVVAERVDFDRLHRKVPWGDQAVLFRTNQQARPLEMAFRQAGIRYHLIGGQSYFDRREVRDLMAYLKVMVNPHSDVSLLRIANVPARGLSDATMERLLGASQERHCSVFSAMRHTDVLDSFQTRARQSIQRFVEWLETTAAMLQTEEPLSLGEWADRFLGNIGYADDLRRLEKNTEVAENRVKNLKELVLDMDRDRDPKRSPLEQLQDFLENLSLDSEREDDAETAGDAVTLITTHSCKGLEFPFVHVVGLEDGLLPHTRSKEEGTLDEERRLFYVAITRAMKSLTLSHCESRKKHGQMMPCHPSPFLLELPEELIEHASEKAKAPVEVDSGKSLFSTIRDSL